MTRLWRGCPHCTVFGPPRKFPQGVSKESLRRLRQAVKKGTGMDQFNGRGGVLNPLESLADALLKARVSCPICQGYDASLRSQGLVQSPEGYPLCDQCDLEGRVWPKPLDWLARQVFERCHCLRAPGTRHVCAQCYGTGHSVQCNRCRGTGWTPYNPERLHWPEGWAQGFVIEMLSQGMAHCFEEPTWVSNLRFWRGTPVPALVEAVEAIRGSQ